MTDIIELTQRMREAAENATRGEWIKENGDGWEAICCDDDQANGNFIIAKFLGPDKARNREFVQAVQPQNIRTLCDAIAQRDAQIAALTAENVALKASRETLANNSLEACNEIYCAGYRNTALYDGLKKSTGDRNTYPNPIRLMVDEATKQLQTPATDAAANALRAEGVELFAELMRSYIGKPNKNDAAASYCAREAVDFAKQLREGK